MKNILIVADNKESTKRMLKKTLRFSPELIRVMYFEPNDTSAEDIHAIAKKIFSDFCETEMIISAAANIKDQTEALAQTVDQINPDMVVIHRPKVGKEAQDYSLIKAVLKSAAAATVLLCGDNAWKSDIKMLATLDLADTSPAQKSLNDQVLEAALNASKKLQAELNFLTVLPVSKIKQELDVVDSYKIMEKKGDATKTELESVVQNKAPDLTFSAHVSVGVPADAISSASQKLKSNIVVLGNVGRTGINGLIVGNTAEKILNRLAVDALIVKQ
jgi:universal stress protein E